MVIETVQPIRFVDFVNNAKRFLFGIRIYRVNTAAEYSVDVSYYTNFVAILLLLAGSLLCICMAFFRSRWCVQVDFSASIESRSLRVHMCFHGKAIFTNALASLPKCIY